MTWLLWQFVEMVFLLALLSILVPSSWPRGVTGVVVIAVFVGAWGINYRWIRRERDDESSRPAD